MCCARPGHWAWSERAELRHGGFETPARDAMSAMFTLFRSPGLSSRLALIDLTNSHSSADLGPAGEVTVWLSQLGPGRRFGRPSGR